MRANSDAERALTQQGRDDVKQVVQSLQAELEGLDLIVTSPYLRARETTEIVQQNLVAKKQISISRKLEPSGGPKDLLEFIDTLNVDTILLVTHQPLVGNILSLLSGDNTWLTTGTANLVGLEMAAPVPGFASVFCSSIPLRS